MQIKFSDVQQKELIDMKTGQCLGFIMDAHVNIDTGLIEYFIVQSPRKFYEVMKREEKMKKIPFEQILTIGSDVILIAPLYD